MRTVDARMRHAHYPRANWRLVVKSGKAESTSGLSHQGVQTEEAGARKPEVTDRLKALVAIPRGKCVGVYTSIHTPTLHRWDEHVLHKALLAPAQLHAFQLD